MRREIFYGIGIIGVVMIALGAFISSGKAQSDVPLPYSQICINSSFLKIASSEIRCIAGDCQVFAINSSSTCQYGCDTNTNLCNPSPLDANLLAVAGIAIFIIVVLIIVGWLVK